MSILTTVRDAIWPHCSLCKKRIFVGYDNAAELQKLKLIGEYQPSYDRCTRLCMNCWASIVTVPCDLCRTSFNVLGNQLSELTQNLKQHSVVLEEVSNVRRVCWQCSAQRLHCACSRCSKPFFCISDTVEKYKNSADVWQWLAPYHKDYQTNWSHLCPDCFRTCLASCIDVQSRLSQWVGSTKGEHVRDFRTVKTLGRVDYKGTRCDEPEKVEAWLRLYTTQAGGNAFVKYYWEKQEERHSDRVVAGYGPKGNPYYKTEYSTNRWFTGYATAVIVEPFLKQRSSTRRMADGPINQQVKYVVIDGLNLCCWANQDKCEPDFRILLTLCTELTRQQIPFLVFFDANTSHLLRERNDPEACVAYKKLSGYIPNVFVEVPGRIRADEFILQRANSDNAHIISNDQYRDFAERYPWVSTGNRLIKGAVAGNRLTIPQLDMDLRVLPDAAAVAEALLKAVAQPT